MLLLKLQYYSTTIDAAYPMMVLRQYGKLLICCTRSFFVFVFVFIFVFHWNEGMNMQTNADNDDDDDEIINHDKNIY